MFTLLRLTLVNPNFYFSYFEEQQHENGVFKKAYFETVFEKASFSATENAVYLWTLTQTDKQDEFLNISGYVWAGPRLVTMGIFYPCGIPRSTETHNVTAKKLTLFSAIIIGIMIESRLRISIPWECFQFFHRIENSITFAVIIVIHKSRKLLPCAGKRWFLRWNLCAYNERGRVNLKPYLPDFVYLIQIFFIFKFFKHKNPFSIQLNTKTEICTVTYSIAAALPGSRVLFCAQQPS